MSQKSFKNLDAAKAQASKSPKNLEEFRKFYVFFPKTSKNHQTLLPVPILQIAKSQNLTDTVHPRSSHRDPWINNLHIHTSFGTWIIENL